MSHFLTQFMVQSQFSAKVCVFQFLCKQTTADATCISAHATSTQQAVFLTDMMMSSLKPQRIKLPFSCALNRAQTMLSLFISVLRSKEAKLSCARSASKTWLLESGWKIAVMWPKKIKSLTWAANCKSLLISLVSHPEAWQGCFFFSSNWQSVIISQFSAWRLCTTST